jgi:hypothetical protein
LEVSVTDLHIKAEIVPLDLTRNYLQGVLCFRLSATAALELINNRQTRAADGHLMKTYISHTERVRKSRPNTALFECNMIPPSIRLAESKEPFKRVLRTDINKFITSRWRYMLH